MKEVKLKKFQSPQVKPKEDSVKKENSLQTLSEAIKLRRKQLIKNDIDTKDDVDDWD